VGAIVDGLALEGVTIDYSVEETVGAIVDGLALEGVTVGYLVEETVGAIVNGLRWIESPSAAHLERQLVRSSMDWRHRRLLS